MDMSYTEMDVPQKMLMKLFDFIIDNDEDDNELSERVSQEIDDLEDVKTVIQKSLFEWAIANDIESLKVLLNYDTLRHFGVAAVDEWLYKYDLDAEHDICGVSSLPTLKLIYDIVCSDDNEVTWLNKEYALTINLKRWMALARVLVIERTPHPASGKAVEYMKKVMSKCCIHLRNRHVAKISHCLVVIYQQMACRMIIALWADGRKRIRKGLELCGGNLELRIIEGLPRTFLGEVMLQLCVNRKKIDGD